MSGGRPSTFTQEMADRICDELAKPKSLRSICADEGMPCQTTVFKWLREFPEFAQQYARAREVQADAIFDEIIDIADTPMLGEIVTTKPVVVEGKVVPGAEIREVKHEDMIAHRKLQIDARKWMAGKLRPKVYGDKIELEHSGEAPPIAITLIRQPDEGSDGA